jgi:protein involved in polysaccharide export with SLBB domain
MTATRRSVFFLIVLLLSGTNPSAAQDTAGWDPTGLQLTRAELQEILARFEETAESSTYSGALREQAAREAALIRARLEEGDMRIGDRILLVVEGHEQLSDTFNVVAGRLVVLPEIGRIPLEGVLRSELQSHLTEQIGRFIRDPVIQVRALVRVQILGAVGNPGFYPVPSDLLITDVLMLAGGPDASAKIEGIEIRRGAEVIWEAEGLREALIEGRTLDQLSVRAGDSIFVPEQRSGFASIQNIILTLSGLASLAVLAVQIGVF